VLLCLSASAAWAQTATNLNCDKCVGTSDIAKGAVTGSRLKNNAVNTAKIKNDAVVTNKIKDGAVISTKIKNGAVTSTKIKDASIKLRDLAAEVLGAINPDLDAVSVVVDCGAGDTIQAEVDAARPGSITTIILANDCSEDVVIAKDDIVISGDPSDSGAQGGSSTLTGGITITGADRVVIDNLTVSDNTAGSFPVGITVTAGSSATITDSILSGHVADGAVSGDGAGAGIFVTRNAYVTIDNVSVTNPVGGASALVLTDGANVRGSNSTFISNESVEFDGAAIGLYRSSSMRLNGTSTVTNTNNSVNAEEAMAINVTDTSDFRMQSGSNTVDGNVLIEGNSGADFRGVIFTGEIEVEGNSNVTFAQSASLTGNIDIVGSSLVQAWSLSVTGAISCSSLSGLESGTLTATGGTGTCNTSP
jgi:hypothetical protein